MLVDQAGELIVDMLTTSPSLSRIASASAILDVSNYTPQAMSLGKDALSFQYHAHHADYPSNNIGISALNYCDYFPCSGSYVVANNMSSLGLDFLPDYPHPDDTRLERRSTAVNIHPLLNISSVNIGHCANAYLIPSAVLYNTAGRQGCYAPSSGLPHGLISGTNGVVDSSFVLTFSSTYNYYGVLDQYGFINVTTSNADHGSKIGVTDFSGVVVSATSNFSSTGEIDYVNRIYFYDIATLTHYGGVSQIGLWCIDLKQLLKEGILPPYSFSPIDNPRKYKLFAKQTFSDNILHYQDYLPDNLSARGMNILWSYGDSIGFGAGIPNGWNGENYIEIKWRLKLI